MYGDNDPISTQASAGTAGQDKTSLSHNRVVNWIYPGENHSCTKVSFSMTAWNASPRPGQLPA